MHDLDPTAAEDDLVNLLENAVQKGRLHEFKALFRNKELLRQLTKGKLTTDQLRMLDQNADKIAQLMQDPRFMALVEKYRQAGKDGSTLSLRDVQTLSDLADKQYDPSALPSEAGAAAGRANGGPQDGADEVRNRNMLSSTGEVPKGEITEDSEQGETWIERQLGRLAVAFDLNDPANSTVVEAALRSMDALKVDAQGNEHLDLEALWAKSSDDAASWMVGRWEWPGRLAKSSGKLYRDIRKSVPELGGALNETLVHVPSGPAVPSAASNAFSIAAAVLSLILLGAIGWKILEKRAQTLEQRALAGIGPWPVQPNEVASPDDVIRAFEYLALLRLGETACANNHRLIAARLGEELPDAGRDTAALDLARLYERARYEPNPLPFAESDLQVARRSLTLLAGGAAA
jgi:hypothetical protein